MPQRFLRPGITNSERWNAVDWKCQSFFIRLLTLVDDYGRFDGRIPVIWAQCYAGWNAQHTEQIAEQITQKDVESMLLQIAAKSCNLVEIYEFEGKKVLQVTQWQERIRKGVKERWPKNRKLQQLAGNCSKIIPPSSPSSSRERGGGTNHPTLSQAIKYFLENGDYKETEVRYGFTSLEAGSVDGFWMWGKHRVGDWRAALETRMADERNKHAKSDIRNTRQSPDRNQGTYNENGGKSRYADAAKRSQEKIS